MPKLTGPHENKRRKAQRCFRYRQSVIAVNSPEQRTNAYWIDDGGAMVDLRRGQRATQIGRWIALSPAGGDGVAKDCAAGTSQPPRGFIAAARFNSAEYRKHLWRCDLGYGATTKRWIGEFEQPTLLGKSHIRAPFFLQLRQNLLGY